MAGIAAFGAITAQDNNLAMNGSFENTSGKIHSLGAFTKADSISSSNNTSVDLFSAKACGRDYKVPENYMGVQSSKTGNNYAGIVAFYADETGIFESRPGYQRYSEYIQLPLREPLTAGAAYNVSFNASLAENSAYAISGLGIYFSNAKMDVQNNAFLPVTPQVVSPDITMEKEWVTLSGTYVASGGERYLTIGAFPEFIDTMKVIPPYTNNSRKAYYYIDDIAISPAVKSNPDDVTMILYGQCYQLKNLNFETDNATIMAGSYDELNSLSRFLKTYPSIAVYIDGHTDKTGTEAHNDKLSELRAAAVKDYLAKKGIKANRMKTRGLGESQPIDTQNANSAANRRVEITVCAVK